MRNRGARRSNRNIFCRLYNFPPHFLLCSFSTSHMHYLQKTLFPIICFWSRVMADYLNSFGKEDTKSPIGPFPSTYNLRSLSY